MGAPDASEYECSVVSSKRFEEVRLLVPGNNDSNAYGPGCVKGIKDGNLGG